MSGYIPTGQTNFNFGQMAQAGNVTTHTLSPPQQPSASSSAPVTNESKAHWKPKFSDLYKSNGLADAQRIRVEETLRRQKERRYDYMNHIRKLTDLFADEEELVQEAQDQQQMEWVNSLLTRKKEKRHESWRFKNQLMHSEWLLERPSDFVENWMMIPVPQGRRNLVIASGGKTVTYAKNGVIVDTFSSHLPGGGKHKHKWNIESAILDCVFNETTKTFYILDMMCWRQTPMYDTETQFRFYWMHEKFLEVPEVATISQNNHYRFEPLPNFRCENENMVNVLSCEMSVPLDGILFYHKLTHYTFGYTPLVLWLKPFMIPEALGIMVPQTFIQRAPPDYRGFEVHKKQCIQNLTHREETERQRMQKQFEERRAKAANKGAHTPGIKSFDKLEASFISSTTQSMDVS